MKLIEGTKMGIRRLSRVWTRYDNSFNGQKGRALC